MTAKEYLAALEVALSGIDPLMKTDVLREMESHIEELRDRKPEATEEEIIAGLTPPETLALGLKEELGCEEGRKPETPPKGESEYREGRGPRRGKGSEFDGFYKEMDDLKREFQNEVRDIEDLKRHIKEEVRELLGRSVRGMAGGSSRSRNDWSGTIDPEGASGLKLGFSCADIEIEPGAGEMIEAEFQIEGEEDTMEGWSPAISRTGDTILLADNHRTKALSVVLRFPSCVEKLAVSTASGDVQIDAGARDCDVDSRSGDIRIKDAGAVRAISASGDIGVSGCVSLRAESRSGDVEAERIEAEAFIKTVSGDIELEEVGGETEVQSVSGDIELEVRNGPLQATSVSGSVTLAAGDGFQGGQISSRSGDIEVELDGADLDIVAESISGDVEVNGREARDNVPRRVRSQAGRGGPELTLRTASGDVTVEEE